MGVVSECCCKEVLYIIDILIIIITFPYSTSTSSKRPCDPDTPTAPPEHPCCAVKDGDRFRVSNCACCHTSTSINMYTNDCLFTSVNNNFNNNFIYSYSPYTER